MTRVVSGLCGVCALTTDHNERSDVALWANGSPAVKMLQSCPHMGEGRGCSYGEATGVASHAVRHRQPQIQQILADNIDLVWRERPSCRGNTVALGKPPSPRLTDEPTGAQVGRLQEGADERGLHTAPRCIIVHHLQRQ